MKILVSFLLGLVLGAAVIYFVARQPAVVDGDGDRVVITEPRRDTDLDVRTTPGTVDRDRQPVSGAISDDIEDGLDRAGQSIREGARDAGDALREGARRAGDSLSEVTADARITATIKTRLIEEPNLSALAIDVDTDNGVVTLSGTVDSREQVERAMELARSVEGVNRVASVLQVDPD